MFARPRLCIFPSLIDESSGSQGLGRKQSYEEKLILLYFSMANGIPMPVIQSQRVAIQIKLRCRKGPKGLKLRRPTCKISKKIKFTKHFDHLPQLIKPARATGLVGDQKQQHGKCHPS
jgi:hypothetical protein